MFYIYISICIDALGVYHRLLVRCHLPNEMMEVTITSKFVNMLWLNVDFLWTNELKSEVGNTVGNGVDKKYERENSFQNAVCKLGTHNKYFLIESSMGIKLF